MNGNDFEDRIETLLREQVDHEVGPRRSGPPFVPSGTGRRVGGADSRSWLRPLLAAACVLLVVGGTFGLVALLANGDTNQHRPPAQPTFTPRPMPSDNAVPTSPPTPKPTATVTRLHSPSAHPSSTQHSSPSTQPSTQPSTLHSAPKPQPTTHTVAVAGATLTLPIGWTARKDSLYEPPGSSSINDDYCIARTSTPPSTKPGACQIHFRRYTRQSDGTYDINVDTDGGVIGDVGQICGADSATITTSYDTRDFGGRSAQWRRFVYACPNGTVYRHEQYVVNSLPGYAVQTDEATPSNNAVISVVVTRSQLPAQQAPLPLDANGIVRLVRHTATGLRIGIQHTVTGDDTPDGMSNTDYFDVPRAAYRYFRVPKVGDRVVVLTDGRRVTGLHG